jgi:protein phosphatase
MQRAEVTFKEFSQWQYRSIKQYRPDLPVWLDLTLLKATSADPRDRFQAFSEFNADFTKPNTNAEQEYKNQPLLQRDPVSFWQGVSLLLFIALIVSFLS